MCICLPYSNLYAPLFVDRFVHWKELLVHLKSTYSILIQRFFEEGAEIIPLNIKLLKRFLYTQHMCVYI